ncbi:SRPBCC family protein [Hydrogenophaga sp. BPS33]|uniref:SRPBCC family protein n=1 Tax=Hydrogenophaga sp. BPS33 TaxID=2651974 RepID=UPI00131FBFD8|nr:SRPBCC family protein [Hydrogenophaga sp. BPS33]QHE88385.1 SRPBCC family protein [Hydrogenophaga sp. BPS33]
MSSNATNTVRLHRVLRAPPEKVYRAFLDADALARWLPPYGFLCQVHHLEPKVGGTFKMSFRNFSTGHAHSFGGEYLELKPGERVRYNDKFDDSNLPGVMNVDVQLKAVVCGTELTVVQDGIPAVIPAEMCYLGWQESLVQLAQLVEPDIPDA